MSDDPSKTLADLLKYLRACVQVAEENKRDIAGVNTALTKQAADEIDSLLQDAVRYENGRVVMTQEIERLQREAVPEVCCGNYDTCRERCIPLVDELRRRLQSEPSAALTKCPYCEKPAYSDGSIYHVGGCRGLDDIKMTRLQYDALVARAAVPPPDTQRIQHMETVLDDAADLLQSAGVLSEGERITAGIQRLIDRAAPQPPDALRTDTLQRIAGEALHYVSRRISELSARGLRSPAVEDLRDELRAIINDQGVTSQPHDGIVPKFATGDLVKLAPAGAALEVLHVTLSYNLGVAGHVVATGIAEKDLYRASETKEAPYVSAMDKAVSLSVDLQRAGETSTTLCTCPYIGPGGGGDGAYVSRADCPVHGKAERRDAELIDRAASEIRILSESENDG